MAKIDDVRSSLIDCQNSLQTHFNDVAIGVPVDDEFLKKRDEYFKWIKLKTSLIDS